MRPGYLETYQSDEPIYPIAGLTVYTILLVSYLVELALDLRWTPVAWTKGVILLFLMSRLTVFSLWTVGASFDLADQINSIGTVMLLSAQIMVVVAWIDLTLKAKHLGDRTQSMKIVRLVLFVGIGVVAPANLLAFILQIDLFLYIAVAVLLLLLLSAMVISVVYLVVIYRWLQEAESDDLTKRIGYKSRWIIVLLVLMTVVMAFLLVPNEELALELAGRAGELVMLICMFFFLENSCSRLLSLWAAGLERSHEPTSLRAAVQNPV